MGDIKFAVCVCVCLFVCLGCISCKTDLAEILHRDVGLLWTLCLAFWWRLPEGSPRGAE